MKSVLVVFIILSKASFAQEFPADWLGSYSGKMLIANLGGSTDTIDADYEISTIEIDSVWSYKMTFYSNQYGTIIKDYRIVAKSKNNNENYFLDENNGIVMELTFMDGTFYGMYEVLDMIFVTSMRYTKEGNIYYDLFASPMSNPTITATKGEESIKATSYTTTLHQTALFKPVE